MRKSGREIDRAPYCRTLAVEEQAWAPGLPDSGLRSGLEQAASLPGVGWCTEAAGLPGQIPECSHILYINNAEPIFSEEQNMIKEPSNIT